MSLCSRMARSIRPLFILIVTMAFLQCVEHKPRLWLQWTTRTEECLSAPAPRGSVVDAQQHGVLIAVVEMPQLLWPAQVYIGLLLGCASSMEYNEMASTYIPMFGLPNFSTLTLSAIKGSLSTRYCKLQNEFQAFSFLFLFFSWAGSMYGRKLAPLHCNDTVSPCRVY